MKTHVLQRELFQLSEQIKQISYKLAIEKEDKKKEKLSAKKDHLTKCRTQIKVLLKIMYESSNPKKESCNVA